MNQPTVGIVYNPIKVELDDLTAAVDAEPGSTGWAVKWLPTSEDDPGQGPAQEALDAGATMVIAVGGDGTVRAVAEVMRGTGIPLALLPSGTGNLLARNLELTLDDTAHSLASAFGDATRTIDSATIEIHREDGSTDSHAFLVMAGAGLDAKVMSRTDPELKKKVGWLAYVRAGLPVLRDKSVLKLTYTIDSQRPRSARAQGIVVGNCGSLPANIMLLPDAVVDDGLLDVIVLSPQSIGGWLAVAVKIFWENGIVKRTTMGRRMADLKSDSVAMHQGKKLTVRLSRPEEVQLDGDPFGVMVGCFVTIEPGALIIKVPQA